jgi:hypothetical protein
LNNPTPAQEVSIAQTAITKCTGFGRMREPPTKNGNNGDLKSPLEELKAGKALIPPKRSRHGA